MKCEKRAKEFNLSDEIIDVNGGGGDDSELLVGAVREFIKLLKEKIDKWDRKYQFEIMNEIDKLAGDKLI